MKASRNDRIAARAYRIWEDEGCPSGKEEEHWRRAEQEVSQEEAGGQMSAQMGDAEQTSQAGGVPEETLDTRPAPPIAAAPAGEDADSRPTLPKRPKRLSRRTGAARPPAHEG